jgi:hypothetical protein
MGTNVADCTVASGGPRWTHAAVAGWIAVWIRLSVWTGYEIRQLTGPQFAPAEHPTEHTQED